MTDLNKDTERGSWERREVPVPAGLIVATMALLIANTDLLPDEIEGLAFLVFIVLIVRHFIRLVRDR